MPTSVGPKSKGKDNLVFGYDTGDTVNSYKGEPTEPLRGTFPTDTEFPTGYHWNYEYDHEIVDAPVSNHFLSNKKWIKSTRDTTGSRRVLFLNNSFTSGSTYTFSCYVYSDDSRLTSLQQLSHNGGYSAHQGGTIYASADLGTVKRIHGTWIQQQNGSSIYGMQTNNAALGTTFYMTGLQVEEKANPTQLTAGSRSADSGSLIDLTGNSTIDVTNVSFDSDAQVDFDGSNDYGEISDSTLFDFGTSDFSMEAVIKGTGTSNYRTIFYHFYNPGFVYITMINTGVMRVWIHNKVLNGNTNILDGKYHHTAFVRQGDTLTFYVDGVEDATSTGWTSKSATNTSKGASIGRYIDGSTAYPFDGAINVLNAYNRALTASEIKANFNAIKGRFNIE